ASYLSYPPQRRPPPPVFPYTTLFRSGEQDGVEQPLAPEQLCDRLSGEQEAQISLAAEAITRDQARRGAFERRPGDAVRFARLPRSEEHTSELQSLAYLVCRLLLEKKK